jgi:hypothetical protein
MLGMVRRTSVHVLAIASAMLLIFKISNYIFCIMQLASRVEKGGSFILQESLLRVCCLLLTAMKWPCPCPLANGSYNIGQSTRNNTTSDLWA